MKIMVKSPLFILLELLYGLIIRTSETTSFVIKEFLKLFNSLTYLSKTNFMGFLISMVIGSVTLLFSLHFIFKSSKMVIYLALIFIILLFVFTVLLIV
jgi:hypothetical protein